jgi:hypothetical protein
LIYLPFEEAVNAQYNADNQQWYADDRSDNRGSQKFTLQDKDYRQDEADKAPAQADDEKGNLQWQVDRPEKPGYIFSICYSSHFQLL